MFSTPGTVPPPGSRLSPASSKVTAPGPRPSKLAPAPKPDVGDLSFEVEAPPAEALKAASLPEEEPASAHAEYGVGTCLRVIKLSLWVPITLS